MPLSEKQGVGSSILPLATNVPLVITDKDEVVSSNLTRPTDFFQFIEHKYKDVPIFYKGFVGLNYEEIISILFSYFSMWWSI